MWNLICDNFAVFGRENLYTIGRDVFQCSPEESRGDISQPEDFIDHLRILIEGLLVRTGHGIYNSVWKQALLGKSN